MKYILHIIKSSLLFTHDITGDKNVQIPSKRASSHVTEDENMSTLPKRARLHCGDENIQILSTRARQYYEQTRFMDDENDYLPYRQKIYAPLLLMYYQGFQTKQQHKKLAKFIHNGQIDKIKPDSGTNVTTEIGEILLPLEQPKTSHFFLVEGAPAIGKSVLLKEIAYRWGIGEHLKSFKLLLSFSFHDPRVQHAKTINDLLMIFCDGDPNGSKIADSCSKYFSENHGEDLLLCFGGFDELPDRAQKKNGLIARILGRKIPVLSKCSLIISSRPHASAELRINASLRVEVLGFTKEGQIQFLQQSLQGDMEMQKIDELVQYLERHLTISSLCYVPFNLVILLYLYKEGFHLPKNPTELYSKFIAFTLCRGFTRSALSSEIGFSDLTNLPEPCNRIVNQLSKLSLEALKSKKFTFTYDEIKTACSDIMTTPGTVNCFGLMRVIKCLGPERSQLFYFIHSSIQEFLAAHHVAQLPPDRELAILKTKFWSSHYSNMFSMYAAMTKGQRTAFKYFLSGNCDTFAISNEFLDDQLKCFHLFHCFHEAGDKKICKSIQNAKVFNDSPITSLAPSDIRCLTIFVRYSPYKKWKELNLEDCQIQDLGILTLHQGLQDSRVTIDCLQLNCNSFSSASSSLIVDTVIKCRVKELWIGDNKTIGDDDQLYAMLSNTSSMLEILHLSYTKLSLNAVTKLFTTLAGEGSKLKILYLAGCNITNEACNVVATSMKQNHSLVELDIRKNPISIDAIKYIFQAIQHNDSLQKLLLPECPEKVIRSQQQMVIKKRESRGNCLKLNVKIE